MREKLRAVLAIDYVLGEHVGERRGAAGQVRAAQIAAISRFFRAIMAGSICNAAVLLVALLNTSFAMEATSWAFALVSYVVFTYLRMRVHQRRPLGHYVSCRGIRKAIINAALSGMFWGLVPVLFFHGPAGQQLLVVCLVIGMMCAGSFVFATLPVAAVAYMTPIAVGGAYALLREAQPIYYLIVALLVSYVVVLTAAACAHAAGFIARVLAQGDAERAASLDSLTGLPNRSALLPALDEAVERCRRFGETFALFSIDLDGFKAVNDRLGHPAGDQLLVRVAQRLATAIRSNDLLARVGGDEFAVLARGIQNAEEAADVAERLIGLFESRVAAGGEEIKATLSIGIVLAPSDGLVASTLLERADGALYDAKHKGRNGFRLFEDADDLMIRRRKIWTRDLRAAVLNRELHLQFQPIFHVGNGSIRAFEALVRWDHPLQGPISPADFIPIAERIGLIREIGDFVIDDACRAAAQWPDDIQVAVNFSLDQFRSLAVVDTLMESLERYGLKPNRFEIELTESILFQNEPIVLQTIQALHAAGFALILDDFGTGFSSLRHLQDLPIDGVKIDRAFTSRLPDDARSEAIVRSIVGLCTTLGIRINAEGVETPEQVATLRAIGCDELQGFLIGRPMDEAAARILRGCIWEQHRLVA